MAQIVRFGFHYSQETHTHTHTKRHKSFKHPKASRKGQNLMTLLYPGINSSTEYFCLGGISKWVGGDKLCVAIA
jgi:hypothetical protein